MINSIIKYNNQNTQKITFLDADVTVSLFFELTRARLFVETAPCDDVRVLRAILMFLCGAL